MARVLGKRSRQVLDVLHFVSSVGWLGVGLCQFTIDVVALSTSDGVERLGGRELAHVFDLDLLLPLALVALGTGVVRAVRSRWGLVRHWWVFVKLVVTCVLMVGDPVFLGAWNEAARRSSSSVLGWQLIGGSVVNVGALVGMTVLSVVKPWGRVRA